jgi:hypothetical protein
MTKEELIENIEQMVSYTICGDDFKQDDTFDDYVDVLDFFGENNV